MATNIRDAAKGDIAEIVTVHERAFPTEFLTSLGPSFLSWYYGHAINTPTGVCLVATNEDVVVGFVCGSYDRDDHDESFLSKSMPALRAAVSIAVHRPNRIPALLQRYKWLGSERDALEAHDIELASLATDPSVQGKGVGKLLVRAFAKRSVELDQGKISLTTNEHGNDGVIAFYEKLGFSRVRLFERDRPMVQFVTNSKSLL